MSIMILCECGVCVKLLDYNCEIETDNYIFASLNQKKTHMLPMRYVSRIYSSESKNIKSFCRNTYEKQTDITKYGL